MELACEQGIFLFAILGPFSIIKVGIMFPYEKLEVYKKAFLHNQMVYGLLKKNKTIIAYLRDQLGRASLSIQLNIAEGSGKFSARDRKNYFVTARSSAFECASIFDFLAAENEITLDQRNEFKNLLEEISKILYVMIGNLET